MKRAIAALLFVLAVCGAARAAGVVEITNVGSSSYIDMPEVSARFLLPNGFVRSTRFSGFEAPERNIEAIAALLRAPYDSIADKIDAEGLKTRGIETLARADVLINGRRGVLIKAVHQDSGTKWGKWILVLDNRAGTLVINGVFVSGDTTAAVDLETMLKGVIPYGETVAESVEPEPIIVEPASGDER